MEEEWTKHIHLTGGHCFQMYFKESGCIRRFRIIMKDGSGYMGARDLDTGVEFEFIEYNS